MITEAERVSMARTTATVGESLDTWFEFAAPDFSPKTVKETRGYIDRSLMPALGTRRLAKLKPADLDAFYRRLLAPGGVGGRPSSPGTVRRIHGILRRALNQGDMNALESLNARFRRATRARPVAAADAASPLVGALPSE